MISCIDEPFLETWEYEDTSVLRNIDSKVFHHQEKTPQFQHHNGFIHKFEKLGNSFPSNSDENDLIQLNTKNSIGQEVLNYIHETEEIGKFQADCDKIPVSSIPYLEIIRCCYSLKQTHHQVNPHLVKKKEDLKEDIQMFSRLYIATQVREGNIQKLFNHETSCPLSKLVKKIGGVKAHYLLEKIIFFHA